MSKLIVSDYQGAAVSFTDEAWFNATAVAKGYGASPTDWLRQRDVAEYIAALAKRSGKSGFLTEFNKIKGLDGSSSASRTKLLGLVKSTGFLRIKAGSPENGGGTWMHPKLAVRFAQWLDVDFAIWCDEQIDRLLRGDQADWRRMRHEAAASYKVMADALQLVRTEAGKESAPYHFMNEAKLVNWALAGHFRGLDRDALSKPELDLLAKLEIRNTVLIATGVEYQERKRKLFAYAEAWKIAHPGALKLETV